MGEIVFIQIIYIPEGIVIVCGSDAASVDCCACGGVLTTC